VRARARPPYPPFFLDKALWFGKIMGMIACEYSLPVNYQGSPPAQGELWAFSYASCNQPIYTIIQNSENGAEFYIQKTLSYGDLLLVIFFSIFLVWGIVRFLWNFVYERK
jgi:hypothetical protein